MSAARVHQGGCHCGAVRFEVETDLATVMECNCSHCSKKGFLLTFVPAGKFTLLSGDDAQTEYRFNTKRIAHRFCPTCGVEAYARGAGPDGSEMAAVNVRCLDDVDVSALTLTPVDGKSF